MILSRLEDSMYGSDIRSTPCSHQQHPFDHSLFLCSCQIGADPFPPDLRGYVHGFGFWSGSYGKFSIGATNIFVGSTEAIDCNQHFEHSRETIAALSEECISACWRKPFLTKRYSKSNIPLHKQARGRIAPLFLWDDSKSHAAKPLRFHI